MVLALRAGGICFEFDHDHLGPWTNGIESACPVWSILIPAQQRTRRRIFAAHDCSDDVGNTATVFQLKAMASMRKTKQLPIASNAAVAAGILKYRISNVNRLAPIKAAST